MLTPPPPQGYTEPRTYIACQGPLPNYIEDFWRMVWQFRIPTIVIVTNLMEGQKVKETPIHILPSAVSEWAVIIVCVCSGRFIALFL